jgi:hypothetical protein
VRWKSVEVRWKSVEVRWKSVECCVGRVWLLIEYMSYYYTDKIIRIIISSV